MANNDVFNEVMPRRIMTTFLLVDTSGSMAENGNIGKVNAAIEEMVPMLREVSDENADAEIKLAVMDFSTGARWVTKDLEGNPGPESLETFFWNDLEAGGLTDMGAAFIELESKLSRKSFLASSTGAFAPVIILLSDGLPNDDWKSGLEKLKHNNWFKNAQKVAIAVDDASDEALVAFTGTKEAVLKVNSNRTDLKALLCRLAVVSSTIQSHSVGVEMEEPAKSGEGDDSQQNSDSEIAQKIAEDAVKQVKDEWGDEW